MLKLSAELPHHLMFSRVRISITTSTTTTSSSNSEAPAPPPAITKKSLNKVIIPPRCQNLLLILLR
jgi:hypothetical protein